MPKDWAKYKAEVHRLYIVEEKTVYQVRDTLRERHGFNASVRAYRMHFDEWGMKKYKATKRRHAASTRHLSSPPTTTPESVCRSISTINPSPSTSLGHVETRSESEPLPHALEYQRQTQRMSDMLSRITPSHNNALELLQIIFHQWQPSCEWSSTLFRYFQDPNFDKWAPQRSSEETPAIFKMVEDYLPEEDRFTLVKSLLEADLLTKEYHDHCSSSWQETWYQACDASEWEDARDLLYEEGVLSQTMGVFRDCALVVLAERLLEGYMRELERWTGQPLNDGEIEARDDALRRYREILSNFHHAKEDVDPEFYRFVLRFCLDHNIEKGTKLSGDEYRLKYIQLSCSTTAKRNTYRVTTSPSSSTKGSRPSSSSLSFIMDPVIQVQRGLPPTPPVAADSPSLQLTTLASTSTWPLHTGLYTLDQLLNRWHSLDCFTDFLANLIRSSSINNDITTFAPRFSSFLKPENLFDLIYRHIADESERMALAKAILLVASTVVPTINDISQPTSPSSTTPLLLQWWVNLYNISDNSLNISVFRMQLLNNPKLEYDLAQVTQSAEGRNLFMDAAVALLSERFLGILKTGLNSKGNQRQGLGTKSDCRQTYMSVMAVMKERGLRLDQGWMRAFMDSM